MNEMFYRPLLGLVFSLLSELAFAGQPKEIVAQVNALTPELTTYVAKYGQSRTVSAPAGTDLLKLVSDNCGSANARRLYLSLFIAANSANDDLRAIAARLTNGESHSADEVSQSFTFATTKAADFLLPACLYAEESVSDVPTNASGPQWQRPTVKGPSARTQIRIAGQPIDFGRLSSAAAQKPPDLGNFAAGTLPRIDERRLSEPSVSNQFVDLARSSVALGDRILGGRGISSDDGISQIASALRLSPDIVGATRALETSLRTQDILAVNKVRDFTKIQIGEPITSSAFRPRTISFAVRPDLDAASVLRGLPTGGPAGGIVLSNFEVLPTRDEPAQEANCTGQVPGKPWPFDVNELRKVLRLHKEALPSSSSGRMLVLDAGFPPTKVGVAPFDKLLFIQNRDSVDDPRGPEYVWSATATDQPVYFLGQVHDTTAYHGVGVLSVALGGVTALESGLLTEYNLVGRDGFIVPMMAFKLVNDAIELDPVAVTKTLFGENWEDLQINVVNVSLKFFADRIDAGASQVQLQQKDTLYVVAAGEPMGTGNGEDIVKGNIEPANWGGKNAPNVLTVGSIDGDDKLSYFSNFGDRVDLAAPGCKVPVFSWDPAKGDFIKANLTGTSFAAPLVSYAANLLKRDYEQVARIKARLVASGRYLANLDGKVWSKRVLDLPTAIAAPFDVIRFTDETTQYGRVFWDPAGAGVSGKFWKRDQVKQIGYFESSSKDSNKHISGSVDLIYVPSPEKANAVVEEDQFPIFDSELKKVTFRPIDETSAPPKLGPSMELDIRNIRSITLCDTDQCWRPQP